MPAARAPRALPWRRKATGTTSSGPRHSRALASRLARRKRPIDGSGVTKGPAPPSIPPPLHLLGAAARKEHLLTLIQRQREKRACVRLRATTIWHLLLALGYGPASPLGPRRRAPSPTTTL